MAVPVFETSTDRGHQSSAAYRIRRHFGCGLIQTKEELRLPWDYEFYRDRALVALGGYKWRNYRRNSFDTYAISHRHYCGLKEAALARGVKCVLFVEWLGGDIGFVDARRVTEDDIRPGGRSPRPGAVHDREPMLHIPIELFKVMPP